MGKSTVAAMFTDLGVPVLDSDATVHQLYEAGGAGVPAIQKLFPDAIKEGRCGLRAGSEWQHSLGTHNHTDT